MDKMGIPRASIEGTNIPMAMIRRYARESDPEIIYDANSKRSPLVVRRGRRPPARACFSQRRPLLR